MNEWKIGWQLAGGMLVAVTLADLYLTVLVPRHGPGFLCQRINRLIWKAGVSCKRIGTRAGDRALAHAGPLMVVFDVFLWGVLLWIGFGMIAYPEMGEGIRNVQSSASPQSWSAALYYAGYSLTTLGTGDFVPRSAPARLLMVVQSGLGFTFFTLSLTFFISIYDALSRRTAFALALNHRTGGSGLPVDYLAGLLIDSDTTAAKADLLNTADQLTSFYEAHHFYPNLHYFRLGAPLYSVPRIAYVALETTCLIRAALDDEAYGRLKDSAAVDALWFAGMSLACLPEGQGEAKGESSPCSDADRRRHFQACLSRLRDAGIAVRRDEEAALRDYAVLRDQCDPPLLASAHFMRFAWKEIAPLSSNE